MANDDIIDFKGETFLEILLIDYRWIIVCFFLLPMSFLYNLWFYVRNRIIFYFNSAPKAHDKKVKQVQEQVNSITKNRKFILSILSGQLKTKEESYHITV